LSFKPAFYASTPLRLKHFKEICCHSIAIIISCINGTELTSMAVDSGAPGWDRVTQQHS